MRLLHVLRMAKWARRPPSEKRVKLVLAVIGICLALYAVERVFGFPFDLTPGGNPGGRLF